MRWHLYPCFVIYFCILSIDEHGSSRWLVVTGFIRVCREDTFWTVAKAPLPWQKSHFNVLRCMCDLPLWGIHISNVCSWTDILTCYQLRHTVMITSGLKYILYWFFKKNQKKKLIQKTFPNWAANSSWQCQALWGRGFAIVTTFQFLVWLLLVFFARLPVKQKLGWNTNVNLQRFNIQLC